MSSTKTILVINGHPDQNSLTQGLVNAYVDAAKQQGHKVQLLNLRSLDFNPIGHHYAINTPLEPDLESAQRLIKQAQHLAVFYPIWWGGMPALLKGFFDRALTPGFAFRYSEKGIPQKLLIGRTVEIFNTTDTPGWLHWLLLKGDKLQAKRNIFEFCGIKVKRHVRFGSVFQSDDALRDKWLKRVMRLAQS
jgi:putative NADPH-quinone reductase